MSVEIPLTVLILLIHVALYASSLRPDRLWRLLQAVLVLLLAWPLLVLSGLEALRGEAWELVSPVLAAAPFYMPFLSFLVYLRRRRNPSRER